MTTATPKISVVTPSYNQGAYLEQTIRSVLEQGYPNLEYIIIDGGSSDDSVEIIKSFENRLAFWVSEPDRGQSHAIEKGFQKATGTFGCWINSDDLLAPDALKIVANVFLNKPDVRVINGVCRLIDQAGETMTDDSIPNGLRRMCWSSAECFADWTRRWFAQQSTFWHMELWNQAGGLDEKLHYAMDLDLWHRFARISDFYIVDEELAAYRHHRDAKCQANNLPTALEIMDVTLRYQAPELLDAFESLRHSVSRLQLSHRNSTDELVHLKSIVQVYQDSRVLRIYKQIREYFKLSRWLK
jgi:glycosyltransferase involved in cell wall biosynthesis